MSSKPERRSMRGWGRYLGDLDQPQTLEEAQLHATMAGTDLLMEIAKSLSDIQIRLTRIEIWIEHNDPGYKNLTPSLPFTPVSSGAQELVPYDAEEAV